MFCIDLYAFEKTLYCALSGQEPEQYPLISAALLRDPRRKQLNQLVKHLCAADPLYRMDLISKITTVQSKISVQHSADPTSFPAACQIGWIGIVFLFFPILSLIGWSGKKLEKAAVTISSYRNANFFIS